MENDIKIEFAQGVFIKMPNKAAPDFVLLDMSFKPHSFFKWAQQFINDENKGWVNIQVLRSKDGSKLYGKLNTYKRPVSTEEAQSTEDYNNTKYQSKNEKEEINNEQANKLFRRDLTEEEHINLDDIPF